MTISRRGFVAGALASLAGCGGALGDFPFDRTTGTTSKNATDTLKVTYFSVGCFLIRMGEVAVLTDPFWSHLPLSQVIFGPVLPDPKQVRPYLPLLGQVRAVVVGHSHYDHVLDLPYVCDYLAPDARIFGSRTLAHTFAPNKCKRPIVAVNRWLATYEHHGRWLSAAGGRVRILPIRSGHPDQYLGVHLYRERLFRDRTTPPSSVEDYQEGATLAYLVDFLADDRSSILHRVYIETSSTGYPEGAFPVAIREQRRVDVALLAMDCANIEASGRYSIIDFLEPRNVIFCHWEDFFRPKTETPHEIVKVDLFDLKARLRSKSGPRYLFPAWDCSFDFPRS